MHFENIVLVGVGGTGSKLVAELMQTVQGNYARGASRPKVWLVDGDTVEPSNLIRQDFYGHEENQPKAETLKRRYLAGTSLRVDAICQYLNTSNLHPMMEVIDNTSQKPLLVVAAVDNINTRVLLLNWLLSNHKGNWLWVSPGNEEHDGQVLSYGKFHGSFTNVQSPMEAFTQYAEATPEGLTARGTAGCGMDPTAGSGTQTMQANMLAATLTTMAVIAAIERDLVTFARYFKINEHGLLEWGNSSTVSIIDQAVAPVPVVPEQQQQEVVDDEAMF
jgi:hypothetical protein